MSYFSDFMLRVRAAIGISVFLASFVLANADSQDLTTAPLSFSVDAGSSGLEVTVSYDTTPRACKPRARASLFITTVQN